MASLLLRNLKTVVTCDDQDTILEQVDLYCEDGVIPVSYTHLDVYKRQAVVILSLLLTFNEQDDTTHETRMKYRTAYRINSIRCSVKI